jgi:Ca2+-binding RTX toxin-like protein/6-phosphogluconolactonase (cycloisomerase 2 family)
MRLAHWLKTLSPLRTRRRSTRQSSTLPLASAQSLENRALLTQLTVITHGRMDQIFDTPDVAPDWAFDIASAINQRDGLQNTEDQIDNSVVRYDTTDFGVPTGGSDDFLIFNWAAISDIDSPGTADDDEVAGVLADLVRARLPDTGTLDLHFIGHSRGSYVTLATLQRLEADGTSEAKIGNLKLTTLDPQDYGIPGINTEDVGLDVPSIVDESENFYQYLFPLGGGKLEGADLNQNLTARLALYDGRSLLVGAEHLEVVDHYYWSIDTDDTTTASYLRDEDLIEQDATIAANRDLLYGPSDPMDDVVAVLDDLKHEVADGVGEFFTDFSNALLDTFSGLEIPLISDQLDEVVQPIVTSLRTFGSDARDVLTDVLTFASRVGNADPLATFQGAMYLILGPGREGLDDLNPDVSFALEPIASALDAIHLDLLLDGPDLGDDIGPSDVIISMGNDLGYWAQVDFHLGQFEVIDLPEFQLNLASLAGDSLTQQDRDALDAFLDGFGFEITSDTGIRTNLRWDLRLGLGVRERGAGIEDHFYINSGATVSGLPTGAPVEELLASVTVFAAPPNESETFATALADATTTDNLRSEVSVGLFQATASDGTPTEVKITAASPLDFSPVTPEDFSADFDVVINEGLPSEDVVEIRHRPTDDETLASFLLALNGQLFTHFGVQIPDIGFTLDFGSVHRQSNPDTRTTPSLVVAARNADISSLTLRRSATSGDIGPEKFGFRAVQYEDARGKSLGFGNNVISVPQPDGTQRLVADLPAPAEGIAIERPDLVLWIGGTRTASGLTEDATPVVISEALDASVNGRDGLNATEALRDLAGINNPESYRQAAENLIRTLVATTTSYPAGTISLEYDDPQNPELLVLVSNPAAGEPAPLLTVTYQGLEKSKLTLTAGIDITNPDYSEAGEEANPGDQRFFNRVNAGVIRSNDVTDVFVPILKGQVNARLHVDANSEDLEGFLQQSLGLGDSVIGLPSAEFDFVFDGGIDFTTFFGKDAEGEQPRDILEIDSLQFDNVVLNIGSTVETVILPVVETLLDALEPVLDIIGDGADSALNARLPLISDIIGDDITLQDILDEIGIGNAVETFVAAISGLGDLADALRAAVADNQGFNLGGWELVMDPESPLYFPRIDVPVPIDLAYAFDTADDIGLDSFLSAFAAFDALSATGFSVDLVKPRSLINLVIGQPFDIVSYGFPKIDLMGENAAEASFDFDWKILSFDIAASLELFADLRFVYDSYGLQQIVDAYRSGADADWLDLIDGFAVQNNPDGYELYAAVGFEGAGSIGDPGVFEAAGFVDLFAELGLELIDPNNDGKLRLDEIRDLTENFTELQNLFCMFDIEGSFDVEVGGSATIAGTSIGSGSMGLSTGDFSLQDLLGDLFGLCEHDETPILAEEVLINGESVLRLNTGPFASNRIHGDVDDSDGVEYSVRQVDNQILITAFGVTDQVYSGNYTRIVATGSESADRFDLSLVSLPVQLSGLGGDDQLLGGSGNDLLNGGDGNDTLTGNDGSDVLLAGTGRNTVSDGAGDDYIDMSDNAADSSDSTGFTLTTDGGADTVIGSRFDDTIIASASDSSPVRFDGGRGNDTLTGGPGDDILSGGDGDDTLNGLAGADQLIGGFGDDDLTGGPGNDVIRGEQGDDTLRGMEGGDELFGDNGNDLVIAGLGDIVASGGSGQDDLLFQMTEYAHIGTLTDFEYRESNGVNVPYEQFESLSVELGNGQGGAFQTEDNYVLNIEGPSLPLTSISGGTGSDIVTIVNLPQLSVGTLITLGNRDDKLTILNSQRPLTVDLGDQGVNGDRLFIDRTSDPVGRAAELSSTFFSGAGNGNIDLTADSIEEISIDLGTGTDQISITGTPTSASVTVNGNDGDDQFFIFGVGIQRPTVLNGLDGNDTATVILPDNPVTVAADEFQQLRFAVETLQVDNRSFANSTNVPVDWDFDQDRISVGTTQFLDALGAETVVFLSGNGTRDTVTVRDSRDVSQQVFIDRNNVRIEEGSNTLSFQDNIRFETFNVATTVDGLDGASGSVVSPDGRFVYVSAADDNSVSVFRTLSQAETTEPLQFVQSLRDGNFGVTGISGASDITMSQDGRHVYVPSGTNGTIAVFERVAVTGRLVYRGVLQTTLGGGIDHITIHANEETTRSLFVTSGRTLLRLLRDPDTGMLSAAEQVSLRAPATGLAASAAEVVVAQDDGIEAWRFSSAGQLPADSVVNKDRGYSDISFSEDSEFFATFDGGFARLKVTDTSFQIDTRSYPNDVTRTNGVAIAYNGLNGDGIVSFDPTSINPPPPEYTLRLDSLTAWGDGQDLTEGNIFTPGWELFVSINGIPVTAVYDSDAFDDATNNTIQLNQEMPLPFPGSLVALWESDDAGGDNEYTDADLLRSVFQTQREGTYRIGVSVTEFGNTIGRATLTFTVLVDQQGPPSVDPVVFLNSSSAVATSPAAGLIPDALSISPDSSYYFGTGSTQDFLLQLEGRTNSPNILIDGNPQAYATASLTDGPDDVQTVFSADRQYAFATSARYGTLSVYDVDDSAVGGLRLIQTIPAGVVTGSRLAASLPENAVEFSSAVTRFVYLSNPAEDSIFVYEQLTNGRLTLRQQLTDGVGGTAGLAGVSDLVIEPQPLLPGPVRLYAASADDNRISAFDIDPQTGELTIAATFTHPDLDQPSRVVLAGDDTQVPSLYVLNRGNQSLVAFSRDAGRGSTAELTHLQTIRNGDSTGNGLTVSMSAPTAIAVQRTGGSISFENAIFVASSDDNSVLVFGRDVSSGRLELTQLVTEGESGVSGIAGVSQLEFTRVRTRQLLIAAGGSDSLAAFEFVNGELTQVQRIRNGAGGVRGVQTPSSLNTFALQLFVGSGGPVGGGPGGISVFDIEGLLSNPNIYHVQHFGAEALTVVSGQDDDIVTAGDVEIQFTLDTQSGTDRVTLRDTPQDRVTQVTLGSGDDELTLQTTGTGATTLITGGPGNDFMRIAANAAGAETVIEGGDGDDEFVVAGTRLEGELVVGGELGEDRLCFDAQVDVNGNPNTTDPVAPGTPDDRVRIAGATYGVTYTMIEAVCILASPVADAGTSYAIREGDSLQLDAAATRIPTGQEQNVSYVWSIGSNPQIATGLAPAVAWSELVAAAVDDDGNYRITLTVTSRLGDDVFTDSSTALLSILNTNPTLNVDGADEVESGQPYTLGLQATDPGADEVESWQIDWGDGTVTDIVFGNLATAQHVYAAADTVTSYVVSIRATDDDGSYGPVERSVTVNPSRAILGPVTVSEGELYNLTLQSPTTAGIDSWNIFWGDGSQSFVSGSDTATTIYGDNGWYRVRATATENGVTGLVPTFVDVSVTNAAPVIQQVTHSSTVAQGAAFNVTVEARDPGWLDTLTYEFDFDNDGLFETSSTEATASFVYSTTGEHAFLVRVRDDDGGVSAVVRSTFLVTNVAPEIQAVRAGSGFEGSRVTVSVVAADAGGDQLEYLFDFDDDGLWDVQSAAGSTTTVFPDNGLFPVTVGVRDRDGAVVTSSINISISNLAPEYSGPFLSGRVSEGGQFTLTVPGRDAAGDNDPLTWSFDLDNDGTYETVNNTGIVTHQFPDDGVYSIPIRLQDDDGGVTDVLVPFTTYDSEGRPLNTSLVPFSVNVLNVDPEVTSMQSPSIVEGQTATVTGTFTDPALGVPTETFTGTAVWNDGVETVLQLASDGTFRTTRYFPDDDPSGTAFDLYDVTIRIKDDDGGNTDTEICTETDSDGNCSAFEVVSVVSPKVTVNNAVPVITDLQSDASTLAARSVDGVVTIAGTFEDLGLLDTHQVTIQWGDGQSDIINQGATDRAFTATHTYVVGGVYEISVIVTDDDTGQSQPATVAAILEGVGYIDGTLYIIGTEGRDHIKVRVNEKQDELRLDAKFHQSLWHAEDARVRDTYPASEVERIVAFLGGGNDHYDGGSNDAPDRHSHNAAAIEIRQIVSGDEGNDWLHGGQWNDALSGGSGNDTISGNHGDDILVGGDGADRLHGRLGRNLLISGILESRPFARQDLSAIDEAMAEWSLGHLGSTLSLLGPVLDDDDEDCLWGTDDDEFVAHVSDRIRR